MVVLPALRRGETVVRGQLPRWGWGKPRASLVVETRRWFPSWGGSPFVCAPLVLPPDRAAFVWSTHSCGLAVASAASSLPLPVFFLPRGPVPLLEAWAAPCPFTCSLLREKTGWEASALIRSGSPSHPGLWRPGAHLSGASGVWSLGVQELVHCSDQQRPPPPTSSLQTCPVLGLGYPTALSPWDLVTWGAWPVDIRQPSGAGAEAWAEGVQVGET